MISVLLADDHAIIRKALQRLIERSADIQVVATASNGIEAVAQVSSGCPDIIVMDVSMPQMDGIEATRHILGCCPLARVLLLSAYDTPDYIRHSLAVGARGYVLKNDAGHQLLDGIHTVFAGQYYFSQKVAEIAEKYLLERK